MEFKIKVSEMQDILNKLLSVVKVGNDGILGMVLIEVKDKVAFKATNGNVSIIITSETAEIKESGTILLKLKDIRGYLSKFNALAEGIGTEYFTFFSTSHGMIKSKTIFENGKSSYRRLKFDIYDPSMFPIMKIDKGVDLILNSTILKDGITKTINSINPMEMRKALSGMYIKIYNDKVVFVGTNGIRLSEYVIPIDTNINDKVVLFSYNLISALRNLLELDKQVFIKFGSKFAYFRFDNIYMVGALIINEEYPDYKTVLNKVSNKYRLPKVEVYDTLKAAIDVLDSEDDNRVIFNINNNKLNISNSIFESEIELDDMNPVELNFSVNGTIIESVLQPFMTDVLDLYIGEDKKFIVFVSEEENYKVLVTTLK